jgi:hypothetical protein
MKLILLIAFTFTSFAQAASYPKQLPREDFEYLVVATHSFNGQIEAAKMKTIGGAEIGGIENVAKYVQILRNRFKEKVILVHAGSLFKKDQDADSKAKILKLVGDMNYDVIFPSEQDLINHKADLDKLQSIQNNIITSNLLEPKSGVSIYNKSAMVQKEYPIQFLGLYSLNNLQEKYLNPYLPGLYVKDEISSALEQINDKAKIKVVLGGFNKQCENSNRSKLIYEWGEDPGCAKKSDIYYMMRKLPKDAVHLIINESGSASTGYLKNTIISQGNAEGRMISLVGISYFKPHEVFDIKKSYAFRPVEVCLNVATKGDLCRGESKGFFARLFGSSDDKGKKATFLNSPIIK